MSTVGSLTDDEIKVLFSSDRLGRLSEIYDVSGPVLVLIHESLNDLGGAIFSSLSIFEVQFRNIISTKLEELFGETWYEHDTFRKQHSTPSGQLVENRLNFAVSNAISQAQKDAYSKQSAAQRNNLREGQQGKKRKRDKKARETLEVSKGDIISSFYISFWRTLFSKTYEPQLWNFGLRDIFPDKTIDRGQVSAQLETIYKVRNRIAHHEFIHPKLCRNYLEAITFLTGNLALLDHIGIGKVYKFQEPYIRKIEFQLSQLEHILGTIRI